MPASASKGYALTDGVGSAGLVLTSQGAGQPATWGGSLANAYLGAFHDEASQPMVNTAQAQVVTFTSTDVSAGVTMAGGSRITVANAGTYNIAFSFQLKNANTTSDRFARFWLAKNGSAPTANLPMTSSIAQVPKQDGVKPGYIILAFNFVLALAGGDYVEVWWNADDTDVSIETVPATPGSLTEPQMPASPSVVCTVTQAK